MKARNKKLEKGTRDKRQETKIALSVNYSILN
jgi:hypothetical protein